MTDEAPPVHQQRNKSIYVAPRRRLVDWLRQQLAGPPEPGSPPLEGLPTERYPCGALYPSSPWGEGLDAAADELPDAPAEAQTLDERGAEPAVVRRYVPPSSLGLSFFIRGPDLRLQILCHAARYHRERATRDESGQFTPRSWQRTPLAPGAQEEFIEVTAPGQRQSIRVLDDRARVDVIWRPFADGWIVTVSLCNTQELADGGSAADYTQERAHKTLFEARLRCVVDAGEIGAYPRPDLRLLDEEEQEIELQYRSRHVYAIGHGCAADWTVQAGRVELRTDTMPVVEVPQMTADTQTGAAGADALSLARLATFDHAHTELLPVLTAFVDGYADWVVQQEAGILCGVKENHAAAQRILHRMHVATERMRAGLQLLAKDAKVRLAFGLAHRAMLDQMRQHDAAQASPRPDDAYRWRPFQLAFVLTTLESVANEQSDFRDTVDLIWFPTGGGKTEAYLGLIALQIALRRLRHPDSGGGTCVLMRYTLRLLARDQFIRAIRLICALELIRRARDDLGTEPISIGMWVGGATSPNTHKQALDLVEGARKARQRPALVLDRCPWCGKAFDIDNYVASAQQFHFQCLHTGCSFAGAGQHLPCNVVDEALYASPPTMLVATVDKFARLAWDARANAFFGGTRHRPPELIVQDELHLIAGALGSVAGLYEAALDTVIQLRGLYPKYIASTATIRMAQQQVRRLYGRDLAVFPPPGLDCDDSYFARTVPLAQRPGRLYLGYLAPMLNRQQCMAPLAAALLHAPQALFAEDALATDLLDAWWTQLVYHGSLKGVGNSHTAFISAVREFARHLRSAPKAAAEPDRCAALAIEQLTSLQSAQQNAGVFARLKQGRTEDGCLDAVLATNMVSVGLDVARLALMVVNGQPLTTAEYIQASSRAGRSDVPGLIVANYYRDQARSLSHYESFRPYHEAFYRFVEPTSVTPYTFQARLRALHAALVIVLRHGAVGLLANEAAATLRADSPQVAAAVERLEQRCRNAAAEHGEEVTRHLAALLRAWHDEAQRSVAARRQLCYQVPDNETGRDRLLCQHGDRIAGLWPTLQSMRSVEQTALLKEI